MDNGSSSAAGFGEDAATGISNGEHMALAYTCYSAFIVEEHHTYPVIKNKEMKFIQKLISITYGNWIS